MIPEAAYAILACARIGAVHSVVFGGFSPDSLAGRIVDCDSKFIVTADEGVRGGRPIPLKKNTDEALKKGKGDEKVLVVRRTGSPVPWSAGRDIWLHEELVKVDADCAAVEMSAEDPLFILYTSGSTGKPKGVLHTGGGYLVFASLTHQHVFDYHDGDRRHPDYAAAPRHQAQARLGDAAVLRHQARPGGREGDCAGGGCLRQPGHPRQLARPDAHRVRRSRALRADIFLHLQGHVLH